jgi:chromate transporter
MNENLNPPELNKPSLKELFASFFKLGLTSFGGPAMVVYIRRLAVEKKQWLDEETFRHGAAICQSLPGSISMQTAAYVGLRKRGISGAAVSLIGFGLPAFILIMVLSVLYVQMHSVPTFISVFSGLTAIVVAITANAALSFGKTALRRWRDVLITYIAAILFAAKFNPILTILISGSLGLLLYLKKEPYSTDGIRTEKSYSFRPVFIILGVTILIILLLFFFQPALFSLSTVMMRIGLFAFGGAYGVVPLMYHEVVDVYSWMPAQTFLDGIVLGQITPGPIVISATFIGYYLDSFIGGILATISIFLPSFILLTLIVPYFDRLQRSLYFRKVITGILCSFVGLILSVTIQFAGNINWDYFHIILASAAFIALFFKADILWVVLGGAVLSIFIQ